MDDSDLTVPAHLQTVLGEAAEQELEAITDHEWPGDDERAARRDEVMAAVDMLGRWEAGCPTRQELVRLAGRAIREQQPRDFIGQWPTTLEEVDGLIARTTMTRELIRFRDVLCGDADAAEAGG
jgi:hypothetical protein